MVVHGLRIYMTKLLHSVCHFQIIVIYSGYPLHRSVFLENIMYNTPIRKMAAI